MSQMTSKSIDLLNKINNEYPKWVKILPMERKSAAALRRRGAIEYDGRHARKIERTF